MAFEIILVLAFLVILGITYWLYSKARFVKIRTPKQQYGEYRASTSEWEVPSGRKRVRWDGSWTHADYNGWCPRCHRSIKVGDQITWWNDGSGDVRWIHIRCR